MAQMTIPKPSRSSNDVEAQTQYLFHRYVHEVTGEDSGSPLSTWERESALHSRAFEELNHIDSRVVFAGVDSACLSGIVHHLRRHAAGIQKDSVLQAELKKIRQNFSKETLWRLCKKIFAAFDDVWTAILTLFVLGLDLCRQAALAVYDIIVGTIAAAVMKWASDWLLKQGGWLAMVPNSGALDMVAQTVVPWLRQLLPSYLSGTEPPSSAKDATAATTPKERSKQD